MATRTSIDTDAFTGTDNAAIPSADWLQLYSHYGEMRHQTNGVRGSSGSLANAASARNKTAGFTDDQYSKLKLASILSAGSGGGIGVIVRAGSNVDSIATNTRNYYYLVVDNSTNPRTTRLGVKTNGGSQTDLATSTSVTWAANDTIELEVEGSTLRAMRNGAEIGGSFTTTDTSLTTGTPGLIGYQVANEPVGDDWEGGNLTSGSSVAPLATLATRSPAPFTINY